MKKILLFTVIFSLIFVACGCTLNKNEQANQELTKVKIAYLPITQAIPLYLALEKGYFEEQGIEVEAIKIENPNLIVDSLISGQVDFGAPSTASGIVAISQSKKPESLKIFALNASSYSVIGDILIVKKDSPLNTISDLKNKQLGILPGIQFQTLAKHILKQNNLTEEDVEIVDIAPSLQVQALAQGQVDAILSVEPTRTVAINNNIARDLLMNPIVKYVANPWYGGCGAVNTEFAKNNPETTKKVIAVIEKAVDEFNASPEEARQYLKNYTALDDELIKEVPMATVKMYDDITEADFDALQKFFDVFYDYEVIDQKVDARQLIYSPAIN